MSGFYKTFIHTNSTTTSNGAIDGGLELSFEKFLFNFHYKRIEPDYQSMGAYYFQSDIRNITIEPTVKIGNNKLTVGGSLGLQRDNLGKTRNYQTDRTIGSIHATWQPAQVYQADVTYSNYDLGQKKGLLDVDTINQISQTTNNIMINQSLNLVSEKVMNTFILSYNHQNLKDRNSNTASNTEFKSDVVFLTWFITFLKAGINAGLTYNYTTFNMSSANTKYSGPGLSLGKNLLKQKMNVSLSWSSYKNFMNNKEVNTINLTSLRCSYRIAKKQKIQLRYSLNKSNPKDNTITPYKENKGDISYVYTF